MTSETIFIGVLLVLQSFWVVTWPVYDNFEFGAKIGQKWSKMAQNTENGLDVWKNNIRNNLHQISARLAIVLSGHMTSIQQFWVWGINRPKVAKMAEKGPKWLKMTEIDWFDVVTALADQFWVPVQIPSSSEAGLAKNLNFGTVKIFYGNPIIFHLFHFSKM